MQHKGEMEICVIIYIYILHNASTGMLVRVEPFHPGRQKVVFQSADFFLYHSKYIKKKVIQDAYTCMGAI